LNQSSIWTVESTWSSCLPLGEDRQVMQVSAEPYRVLGQVLKDVLDHRGLGVHAHDLVRLRDRVQTALDQFLDQLGPLGLVLNQSVLGGEPTLHRRSRSDAIALVAVIPISPSSACFGPRSL
jgi:hypothetical protein